MPGNISDLEIILFDFIKLMKNPNAYRNIYRNISDDVYFPELIRHLIS